MSKILWGHKQGEPVYFEQVYAGEWIDSKGVINTNCNTAPDYRFTIMVKY